MVSCNPNNTKIDLQGWRWLEMAGDGWRWLEIYFGFVRIALCQFKNTHTTFRPISDTTTRRSHPRSHRRSHLINLTPHRPHLILTSSTSSHLIDLTPHRPPHTSSTSPHLIDLTPHRPPHTSSTSHLIDHPTPSPASGICSCHHHTIPIGCLTPPVGRSPPLPSVSALGSCSYGGVSPYGRDRKGKIILT